MTFAELRSKVRAVLQDSNGDYWSDDELDLYLNEAQEEFCRHTRVLRGEHPITTRENQAVYTLPEDCLEVLRVVGKNGAEVEPSHSRSLHGYRLDTTGTGDPTYRYSDLDGDGKMRFYPQPSPTIETGPTTFVDGTKYLVDLDLGIGTVNAVVTESNYLYVTDETNLYQYEIDTDGLMLRNSIAHGISITDPVYIVVIPNSHYQPGNPVSGWTPQPGDIWIHHNQRSYMARWGTGMSTFVTISDYFAGVAKYPLTNANYQGWVGVDGQLYSRQAWLPGTEVASGITGLGAITYSEGDSTTDITRVLIDGNQYELDGGTWSGPVTVTITDPRIAASGGWTEIVSTTDMESTLDFAGNLYVIIDGDLKKAEQDSPDLGAVVYWNGSSFDQEFGAMVDLASDDLVTFDSEIGIVTSFITAEKVATAYYVRKPQEGLVEISDALALVWYAISRAYEQDGEQSHLARAQYYSRKFRDIMGRTKRRVSGGFNGNTSPRKGRYY